MERLKRAIRDINTWDLTDVELVEISRMIAGLAESIAQEQEDRIDAENEEENEEKQELEEKVDELETEVKRLNELVKKLGHAVQVQRQADRTTKGQTMRVEKHSHGDILDLLNTACDEGMQRIERVMTAASFVARSTPDTYTFDMWWEENREVILETLGGYYGNEGREYPQRCWNDARRKWR